VLPFLAVDHVTVTRWEAPAARVIGAVSAIVMLLQGHPTRKRTTAPVAGAFPTDRADPQGTCSLSVPVYSAFLAEQYLSEYLPAGGAAVKMAVVGSPETAARLQRAVGAAADVGGCLFVAVSVLPEA